MRKIHLENSLNYLRQMIIILAEIWTLSRLKQKFTGEHLENHACETPHVSRWGIFHSDDDLNKEYKI